MPKIQITVEKREGLGKKVKKLRQQGILPANIFGKKIKSLAVQVDLKEFAKIFEEAGETGVVDLKVGGEKETRPVLIQNVSRDPVTDDFLHADLRQIILTEKVKATIPVELFGEAPAVTQNVGVLVQVVKEIEVEALPTDLPEHFQVDVGHLEKIDEAILVKDLKFDKDKVELKVEEGQIIVKIEPPAKEEVVVPPPAEVLSEGEEGKVPAAKKEGAEEAEAAPAEKKAEEKEKPAAEQ